MISATIMFLVVFQFYLVAGDRRPPTIAFVLGTILSLAMAGGALGELSK